MSYEVPVTGYPDEPSPWPNHELNDVESLLHQIYFGTAVTVADFVRYAQLFPERCLERYGIDEPYMMPLDTSKLLLEHGASSLLELPPFREALDRYQQSPLGRGDVRMYFTQKHNADWSEQVLTGDEQDALRVHARDYVLRALEEEDTSYVPLHQDALLLLTGRSEHANVAMADLELFPDVVADQQLADFCMKHNGAATVLKHIDEFEGTAADRRLAYALAEQGQGELIFSMLERFAEPVTDRGLAERLVATREGGDLLFTHHDLFRSSLDSKGLADLLIAGNRADLVAYYPEDYDFTLDASWAQKMIANKQASVVLDKYYNFQGIKPDASLALSLINEDNDMLFWGAFERGKFQGPMGGVACALARKGSNGFDAVRGMLDRFSGFTAEQVQEFSEIMGRPFREFPLEGSRADQERWYAEFAYDSPGSDVRKAALGRLIAYRLVNIQGESTLHDATQWLAVFACPTQGYSVRRIAELRNLDHNMSVGDILEQARVTYKDIAMERTLLGQLFSADEALRSRLTLPTREDKLELMFSSPAMRFVYRFLLDHLNDRKLFSQNAELNFLYAAEPEFSRYYAEYLSQGGSSERTIPSMAMWDMWLEVADTVRTLFNSPASAGSITKTVSTLQGYGLNRRAYADDMMTWLSTHTSAPNASLTKAWGDRPRALASGAKDGLASILAWQSETAYRDAVMNGNSSDLPQNITRDELLSERWRPWSQELSRVLSVMDTIQAIGLGKAWLQQLGNRPKQLPPAQISISNPAMAGKQKPYRFDILAADDPRGLTIGIDTGCCMNMHGQAASCVAAGYAHPNAGFIALNTPDNVVGAQSFWYIHPRYPSVLVLDNIEANKGRDTESILKLYREALQVYLSERPELAITHVHVGEGYTGADLSMLPEVDAVPPLNETIYTDARRQRLLLTLVG